MKSTRALAARNMTVKTTTSTNSTQTPYFRPALAITKIVITRNWVAAALALGITLILVLIVTGIADSSRPQFGLLFATPLFLGLLTLALGTTLKLLVSSRRFACVPGYTASFVLATTILYGLYVALPGLVVISEGLVFYSQYLLVSGMAYLFYLSLLFGRRPWLRGWLIFAGICAATWGLAHTELAQNWLFFKYGDSNHAILWSLGVMTLTICLVDLGFRPYLLGPVGSSQPSDTLPNVFEMLRGKRDKFHDKTLSEKPLWWWYRFGLLDLGLIGRVITVMLITVVVLLAVSSSQSRDETPSFLYFPAVIMLTAMAFKMLGMTSLLDSGKLRRAFLQSPVASREQFWRQVMKFRLHVSLIVFSLYTVSIWLFGLASGMNVWALPLVVILGYCVSVMEITVLSIVSPPKKLPWQIGGVLLTWLLLLGVTVAVNYWQVWSAHPAQYAVLAAATGVSIWGMYRLWLEWARQDSELRLDGPRFVKTIIHSI